MITIWGYPIEQWQLGVLVCILIALVYVERAMRLHREHSLQRKHLVEQQLRALGRIEDRLIDIKAILKRAYPSPRDNDDLPLSFRR